jgi:hypothetical protein
VKSLRWFTYLLDSMGRNDDADRLRDEADGLLRS